jgi:hypothetical protein
MKTVQTEPSHSHRKSLPEIHLILGTPSTLTCLWGILLSSCFWNSAFEVIYLKITCQ